MTNEQVAWASLHDWFQASSWISGNRYRVIVKDGKELLTFTDYRKLKSWAGY